MVFIWLPRQREVGVVPVIRPKRLIGLHIICMLIYPHNYSLGFLRFVNEQKQTASIPVTWRRRSTLGGVLRKEKSTDLESGDCCSFFKVKDIRVFFVCPTHVHILTRDLSPRNLSLGFNPPLPQSPPWSYLGNNRISDMTREAAMECSIIAMATWDGCEGSVVVIRHGVLSSQR